ncbi:MAG: hypothetical protein ACXAAH_14110, partial [Promethearchaeota archaeon]
NSILPIIQDKIDKIFEILPRYDVIAECEKLLGTKLSSNEITVYLLHYVKPHGIIIKIRWSIHFSKNLPSIFIEIGL